MISLQFLFVITACFFGVSIAAETPISPCATVFTYEKDGSQYYGKILLKNDLNGIKKVEIEMEMTLKNQIKDKEVIIRKNFNQTRC